MISKFDSLYAGHVDMDNVGYGGTAVNDRRFPNEYLVTTFDKAQAIAQTMDEQGVRRLLAGRAPLPARGLRVHPERSVIGAAPDPP